jgi:hypothetical protein
LQVTQATLSHVVVFHFFPLALRRCNADEQSFIFGQTSSPKGSGAAVS